MPPPNLDLLLTRRQYEQVNKIESAIARAWLVAHGAEYDAVEFNVRLGAGQQLGPEFSDATRAAAQASTQKRADIVVTRAGQTTIIEIKERIGFSVLGQLLGYRALYLQDHPELTGIQLLAIGQSVRTDVEPVLREHGIALEYFPNVTASPASPPSS